MLFLLLTLTSLYSMAVAVEGISAGLPSRGYASLTAADQLPNATHSINFQHANSGLWNWTVRVSDVSMPNASQLIPDAHVAYTTYSFSWPGQGTLQDALNAEAEQESILTHYSSCAVLFDALFPTNVTDKFDDSSSDCTSMLGAECVKALTTLVGSVNGDCKGFSIPTTLIQEQCASSFGVALGGGYGFNYARFGDYMRSTSNTSSPGNQTSPLKGQPYAYSLSVPFAAGNRTAFDPLVSNVHILGLKSNSFNLLCNRAGIIRGESRAGDHNAAPNLASNLKLMVALTSLVLASMLFL